MNRTLLAVTAISGALVVLAQAGGRDTIDEISNTDIADIADADDIDRTIPLCGTTESYYAKGFAPWEGGIASACPLQGACDDPVVRNSHIPGVSAPVTVIRLRIHGFANTNGSNPATSMLEISNQIARLNLDFAPHHIQYIYTAEIINDSTFREFDPNTEEAALKSTYADDPATQINIYVVNVGCCYGGLGTFPWDPDALGTMGGIIMDDNRWDANNSSLAHEVGHCLGLWHTHHGVSEVPGCSDCYEPAPAGSDTKGDFCADTPPTPTETFADCDGAGGSDGCSGNRWLSQPANYMSYADTPCWSLFTSQQAGRMHCWLHAVLSGWIASLSEVWVDFSYAGAEAGTESQPYNTLAEALAAVTPGGTIKIKPGSSALAITISGAVTLNAVGGPVTIGQ